MDALWPDQAVDIEVTASLAEEARPSEDRPWVTMMMISSLDGAAAADGLSGPLGAPADKAIFAGLRSWADAVIVGGGTARDEDYGPIPLRTQTVQDQRHNRGQLPRPVLAVVSGRLAFEPDSRLFSDPDARPLLFTVAELPEAARSTFASRAEVITAGQGRVDPAQVVSALHARGHRQLLLEGGPRLNSDFLAADLVDEIHLSLAPVAIGAPAPRIIEGQTGAVPRPFALQRVWTGDGLLFLRYLRG